MNRVDFENSVFGWEFDFVVVFILAVFWSFFLRFCLFFVFDFFVCLFLLFLFAKTPFIVLTLKYSSLVENDKNMYTTK